MNQINDQNSGGCDNSCDLTFTSFSELTEDLKQTILSFVADAPLEKKSCDGNYFKSTLTHTLPLVSKEFRYFSQQDCHWKAAVERQTAKKFLWKEALRRLCHLNNGVRESTTAHSIRTPNTSAEGARSELQRHQEQVSAEDTKSLLDRAHSCVGGFQEPKYKSMYKTICSSHLRFNGLIFGMPHNIELGQLYGLHFFEPRYRALIASVMQHERMEEIQGHRVFYPKLEEVSFDNNNCMFIHAHHNAPLRPGTSATLVKVIACGILPDGRADVNLLPIDYVSLEKVWVIPDSGRLYACQCVRKGMSMD